MSDEWSARGPAPSYEPRAAVIVRDVFFVAPQDALSAMEAAHWRAVVVPDENLGLDVYFERETAIGAARAYSRTEGGVPGWVVRAAIGEEALEKWRAADPLAEKLGEVDDGAMFLASDRFLEFSADLVEPLEVLGAFA